VSEPHPISAAFAADTVEGLQAAHGRAGRGIFWLLLAGVSAALGALPLVEIDLSISASGVVRPAAERVEITPPLNGRVARVFARENERLQAGQPVLEVATPDLDERLARHEALLREKRQLISWLETLSAARFTETVVDLEVTGERAAELSAGLRALRQEFAQVRAQWESNQIAEAKAGTELARATALAEKGLATQRELDDARFAVERVRAEGIVLVEQARTRWRTRAEEESAAVDQLRSEWARFETEREQAVLRAPLAGTLLGLVGVSTGSFVTAGRAVASVSPDDRLLVETLVASRDVGGIFPGQSVRLQVDAFPYTQWGMLEGKVAAVAADASGAGNAALPVFKIVIEPTRTWLALANGARAEIGKGMTVSVRFLTARRTLLQVLYQDASEWLDPRSPPRP
jgi:HlyD family secretion protein